MTLLVEQLLKPRVIGTKTRKLDWSLLFFVLLSFRNTRVYTVVFYVSIDNIVRGDQEEVVVGFRNFCVLKLREINHNKLSSAITGSNFNPEIIN